MCVYGEEQYQRGRPTWVQGPRGRPGRHQNQCSVQYVRLPVRRPSGSQLEASPGSEPLVGWGYVTSVPARPCLAVSCCITRARFAGGGGGEGCPRPLLEAWPPCTDTCWRRLGLFAEPPPPPPVCAAPPPSLCPAPRAVDCARAHGGGDARRAPGRSSAEPPVPPQRMWRTVCVCVSRKRKGVATGGAALGVWPWRSVVAARKALPLHLVRGRPLVPPPGTVGLCGPQRYDGARVEITGIRPGRLLGSSFPQAPLPLTHAVAGRRCRFPLRSSLFVPHRQSLGSGPSSGTSVGYCRGRGSCS